jgi:multidrug efflux pump subunit AcrB
MARSVRALFVPLLSCTVTTILSFMPLILLPGSVGEFVSSVGWSVLLALSSALCVALTIIAALTGLMYQSADVAEDTAWWRTGLSVPGLTRVYSRTLRFCLARPGLSVLLALVLPVCGFLLSRSLPEQFFPPADRDQFQMQLTLPSNASLVQTQDYALRMRHAVLRHPEVANVHWFVGESAPKFYYNLLTGQEDAAFFAQALVQLRSTTAVTPLIRLLQAELDQLFPGAQVIVKALEQGPPFAAPIEIHLYGPDLDRLAAIGESIRGALAQLPDVVHTQATLRDGKPKLALQLDAEAVRLAGLDNLAVAAQLHAALEGASGGSLIEATEELPVRVRTTAGRRREFSDIAALDLVSSASVAAGRGIPLTALGEFHLVPEMASIPHRGGERVNTIRGFLTAGVLPASILKQLQTRLQAMQFTLPPGYRYDIGGEAAQRNTAVEHLFAPVGVLLVLMAAMLVLTCHSFRIAGILAGIGVLSVGLALAALWVSGYACGFTALVGIVGLVGIAIDEATVMLAALHHHPQARLGDSAAMHEVILGETQHLLSTSMTTIIGFVPLIVTGGGFWPPLAIAIAGGVTGSTLLAVYFAPAAYLLLMRRGAIPAAIVGPVRGPKTLVPLLSCVCPTTRRPL